MHTLVHEQDIRDEGIALGRLEMIQNALKGGSSPDEIARILGISSVEQGIEQGIERGLEQGKLAITQRLLQKNYSDEEIMDIVDCTQELIDEARNM